MALAGTESQARAQAARHGEAALAGHGNAGKAMVWQGWAGSPDSQALAGRRGLARHGKDSQAGVAGPASQA